MVYLLFYRSGAELMRVRLERDVTTIGTSPLADVAVPDRKVAPFQAAIVRVGEGYRLIDRSGRGTLLEKSLVTEAELPYDSVLSIGAFRLHFREDGGEEAAGSSASVTIADRTKPVPLPERLFIWVQQVGGAEQARAVPLGEGLEIGSRAEAGLRLDHPAVSARHARLFRFEGRLLLRDLESTNGIQTVMGAVRDLDLKLGAHLQIGPYDLWVVSGERPPRPAARELEGMISAAPVMHAVFDRIQQLAASDMSVLIQGETGTGKELVARALHRLSDRAIGPFVPVNCGGLPRELIEAELFGHEIGAFTGAVAARKGAFRQAHRGTLFLDELGELPIDAQPKLLRALEERQVTAVGSDLHERVDVRFVCATHHNLLAEAQQGRFRSDLYYRLASSSVALPPLRDRKVDLPLLWELLARDNLSPDRDCRLGDAALAKLLAHDWPGNIRELRSVAQCAILSCMGTNVVGPEFVEFVEQPLPPVVQGVDPRGKSWAEIERASLEIVLRDLRGNRTAAAQQLGMARQTLIKKIEQYGLDTVGLVPGVGGLD